MLRLIQAISLGAMEGSDSASGSPTGCALQHLDGCNTGPRSWLWPDEGCGAVSITDSESWPLEWSSRARQKGRPWDLGLKNLAHRLT